MEQFDKYIKEQLADHEITPPAGFWHQISDQLNKEEHVDEAKHISPFNWKQALRVAAVVVVLFGLGGFLRHQQSGTQVALKPATPASKIMEQVSITQPETQIAVKAVLPVKKAIQTTEQKNSVKTEVLVPQSLNDVSTEIADANTLEIAKTNNEVVELLNTSIPVYSLKLLNSRVPENDEITVIEKNGTKKLVDDSKKVIILQKSISKKPEIYFQVPLRF